jgi:uncharacterized protein YjbI with pentapeptide repeats
VEAKRFQKDQAEEFPLSVVTERFIQASVKQQRWSRIKVASWLIIPALLLVGMGEAWIRAEEIKADYSRLDSESKYEEKRAIENLVLGCEEAKQNQWVPKYFAERIWGYCESLYRAPLGEANLSYADLSYADLRYADLRGAYLRYIDLRGASLRDANLGGAFLWDADLRDANLWDAILINADLSHADLRYTDFLCADLRNADLRNADLRNAILADTNLSYANLRGADLRDANLWDAILWDADLRDADLRNAILADTKLRDANLSYADLSYADLSDTDLSDTDLSYAILLSTNFTEPGIDIGAGITRKQLETENSPLLCATYLPPYMTDIDPHRDCDEVKERLVKKILLCGETKMQNALLKRLYPISIIPNIYPTFRTTNTLHRNLERKNRNFSFSY